MQQEFIYTNRTEIKDSTIQNKNAQDVIGRATSRLLNKDRAKKVASTLPSNRIEEHNRRIREDLIAQVLGNSDSTNLSLRELIDYDQTANIHLMAVMRTHLTLMSPFETEGKRWLRKYYIMGFERQAVYINELLQTNKGKNFLQDLTNVNTEKIGINYYG